MFILKLVEYFLHIDKYLLQIIHRFGSWTYGLLFFIVFCETGLVVTPFLPGDSLLFAAGSFAALGALNVVWLFLLLSVAAILGDTVNYSIGRRLGTRAFEIANGRFLKKEHLEYTQSFYKRHGSFTIIIARFIPIIRTFAPFVAGVGQMEYGRFILYNVIGGVVWVALFTFGGYFFGQIPFVQQHFSWVILTILVLSVVGGVVEIWRKRATPVVSDDSGKQA